MFTSHHHLNILALLLAAACSEQTSANELDQRAGRGGSGGGGRGATTDAEVLDSALGVDGSGGAGGRAHTGKRDAGDQPGERGEDDDAGASEGSAEQDAEAEDAAAGGNDGPTATPACGDDLDVQNGTLTASLGELPTAMAFEGDPAQNGPFTFATRAISVALSEETFAGPGMQIALSAGTIAGNAWLPDDTAAHELVLVLPGFATSYTAYTAFAEHLASHGFIVVGLNTRSNLFKASHDTEAVEIVRTLDWLLDESPFKERIDADKIAVAGHSKGGKLAFFAAALDARIDLVIGWDPVNGGGGPCAFDPNCNALPVAPNCTVMAEGIEQYMRAESLVIGAPPDPNLNPEENQNCVHFYRGAPSPASLIVLDTGHGAWTNTADEPEVFRVTKAAHLARLLQLFRNATGLDDYLPKSDKLAADPLVKLQTRK